MLLWERPDWPDLRWQDLSREVSVVASVQTRFAWELDRLGVGVQHAADLVVEEAAATTNVTGGEVSNVGLLEVLGDATANHDLPMTAQRLLAWHGAVSPDGGGAWRTTDESRRGLPVHQIPAEVDRFLSWWAAVGPASMLRSGIGLLWMETIRPFEAHNGILGRALADTALAKGERRSRRTYTVSSLIAENPRGYYTALAQAQRGGCDITVWLRWWMRVLVRAVDRASLRLDGADRRRRWVQRTSELKTRPKDALRRLYDHGERGLTNRAYRSLTGCSAATASRDLAQLEGLGFLVRSGAGGRSTRYDLVI